MAEWYYTRNNQQMGPVSWDELRQLASTGLLHPTDMVWKEGMVDWQRSGKVDGLHGDRAASRRDDADDRPRRRRDRDDYDDDYDDRPRRRRRSSEGMPLGAKVAIIGGSIAVGLLVLVIVIVVLVRGGSGGGVLGPNDYQVTLFPGQSDTRSFFFQAGQNVQIRVTSQTDMRTDIDLFVERANGFPVASDTRISKDCFVAFVAPVAENYRVRVVNLPGNRNRAVCTVNIR